MNKVDFFMIVTGDRDPDIADYAIKGFSKIKGLDFRLVVYSNYIHPVLKKRYFPRWSRYPYVDLVRNDFQDGTEPEKTGDVPLEGPFDPGWLVWDRNLKGLKARYVATVDADFEILSERFVHRMIEALDTDREAMGASVYYCPEVKDYFDTYRGTTFDIVGHWGSWCSIYRREGLDFGISMRNRFEKAGGRTAFWEDQSFFQHRNMEAGKMKMLTLEDRFCRDFIHYRNFAKNTLLNERNIGFYRRVKIIKQNGVAGLKASNVIGRALDRLIFRKYDMERTVFHKDFRRFGA